MHTKQGRFSFFSQNIVSIQSQLKWLNSNNGFNVYLLKFTSIFRDNFLITTTYFSFHVTKNKCLAICQYALISLFSLCGNEQKSGKSFYSIF